VFGFLCPLLGLSAMPDGAGIPGATRAPFDAVQHKHPHPEVNGKRRNYLLFSGVVTQRHE
jgi:hypothetical protein